MGNATIGLLCLLCLLLGLVAGIAVRIFKDEWDRLGLEAKVRALEARLSEAEAEAHHWEAAWEEAISHASHALTTWMDFKQTHGGEDDTLPLNEGGHTDG